MNLIVWLFVGALAGRAAAAIMRTQDPSATFMNMVIGIVGALMGGWLMAPLFSSTPVSLRDFSAGSLLAAVLGAAVLLALSGLIGRRTARS